MVSCAKVCTFAVGNWISSRHNETNTFKSKNIMAFLSNEKLLIVGAGGMIGSNMVQSALMLGLTVHTDAFA